MSFPLDCACTPPTITPPVNTQGTAGVNAYSILAAQITIPTLNNTVTITVDSTLWMVVGQYVLIGQGASNPGLVNPGPGLFLITAIGSTTSFTGRWLGGPGDVAAGAFIDTGATVSPAYSLRSSNRGTATLVAGTVTVTGVTITSQSIILLSRNTLATAVGHLSAPSANRTPGVGTGQFVIRSDSAPATLTAETSTIDWIILG